jgi:hypothetical protein
MKSMYGCSNYQSKNYYLLWGVIPISLYSSNEVQSILILLPHNVLLLLSNYLVLTCIG